MRNEDLEQEIFSIQSDLEFERAVFKVFEYQYHHCSPYRAYVDLLGVDVKKIDDIPFLPIEFFKTKTIQTAKSKPDLIFESSGTTGNSASKHAVIYPDVYERSFKKCFQRFYGDVRSYRILALLPAYLERSNSSLVYMVNKLIKDSENSDSGFYLHNFQELNAMLNKPTQSKTLLIGVSFGLLDFIESYQPVLRNTIVMETGGMKGRRKEIIRAELHSELKRGFGTPTIHSEYGMTELLSQAYSQGEGVFETPPWMKILIREVNDPFTLADTGKTGGVNVIDLANLYSCSFIATSDLGREINTRETEILGRFDYSDIRGCNLMLAN